MDFMNLVDTWGATLVITVVLGLVGYIKYYKKFEKEIHIDPFCESDAPQTIASLGVLGTFLGITYSLVTFNSINLQASIPTLLDGMKAAFITSILGMVVSLFMKKRQKKLQEQGNPIIEASMNDLIAYLKEQDSKNNKQRAESINEQKKINAEIKLMREEMVLSFNNFANQMVASNTEAFVKAIELIIKDFNIKIQEQFGENFKQLNIAVAKLLIWQENYKKTIEEATRNQKIVFAGIEKTKISLSNMAINSDKIQESAKTLSNIILTAERYQQELETSLESLVELSTQAEELIPNINRLFVSTKGNLSQIAQTAQNDISTSYQALTGKMSNSTQLINELIKKNNDLTENAIANLDEQTNKIEDSTEKAITSINTTALKLQNTALKITEQLSDRLFNSNDELKRYNENIANAFNDNLIQFSQQLVQISDRFAEDYIPLAEKLKEVVEISKNLKVKN